MPVSRILACLPAGLLGLAALPPAAAQSFEQDEWRYVSSHPAPELPLYYTNMLSRDPNTFEPLAELVDNTYPTNLGADDLDCDYDRPISQVARDVGNDGLSALPGREFEVSAGFADAVLELFGDAAGWLDRRGFAPIHTYARMPEYQRVEDPETGDVHYEETGDWVNLIGCDPANAYFSTTFRLDGPSAHAIEFGHRAAELRDTNILSFWLTSVHEFMHVYPYNHAQAFLNGGPQAEHHWVSEALPDTIALRYVADRAGGYDALFAHGDMAAWRPESESMPARYSRRFYQARPYFIPLNLAVPGGGQDSSIYSGASRELIGSVIERDYSQLGYITNGFWTHVMERYLDNDPSLFHGLLQTLRHEDLDRLMARTDAWLDELHDPMTGIEHVFPQFLAEYEGWWDGRVDYNGMTEARWLDYGFNGCEEIELGLGDTAAELEIEIASYAGRCIDIVMPSLAASLTPDLDIAAWVDRDPVMVNHLYLAQARMRNVTVYQGEPLPGGGYGDDASCYELVEAGTVPRGGCLLDPEQGEVRWDSTGRTVTARTFNVTEVGNSGARNVRLRFILAFAHSGNLESSTHMSARDVNLVATVTFADLEEDGAGAGGGGGKARLRRQVSAGGDGDFTVVYGHRRSRGPISTNRGGAEAGQADFADIFTGNLAIPGMTGNDAMSDAMREAGNRMLTLAEDRADGRQGRTIGFLLENPLEPGHTGPVTANGIYEAPDGRSVGIQDPDRPTRLVIEDHTEYTLRFSGEVNVCVFDRVAFAMAARSRRPDPCRDGERRRFEVSGAVGFPGIRSGRSSFTRQTTPELEAYQNLRLSRISQLMGDRFGPGPSGPPTMPDIPMPSGPAPSSPSGQGASPDRDTGARQCDDPILDGRGQCDCSCEAFACLEVRADARTITPPEMQCAMQCTGAWAQCAMRQ
ncbi:MAG: hypothetical protein U9P68_14675 [Pseudomonadota bacterium]|nr:hypothetical protein [Pseudomonadota bacterium]